jgi:hypothetical protein
LVLNIGNEYLAFMMMEELASRCIFYHFCFKLLILFI